MPWRLQCKVRVFTDFAAGPNGGLGIDQLTNVDATYQDNSTEQLKLATHNDVGTK